MANLLETIRSNSQPQQAGVTDETQRLQTLLRAKSGKSVGGPAVAASSLGEQQAVAQTNQQLQQQVAPQAAIQSAAQEQQQAGIQQAERIEQADISQSKRFNETQNRIRTEALLNDLERDKGKLDLARDNARLEQLASGLRLQDRKYIDNLQREGSRRRLDNSLQFNQELTRTIFDDNQKVLEKNLNGQSILNANDREFKKSLAQMSASEAYDMFKDEQKAAKERAVWQAIGAGTQAGASAYGASQNSGGSKGGASTGGTGTTVGTGDVGPGNAGNVG